MKFILFFLSIKKLKFKIPLFSFFVHHKLDHFNYFQILITLNCKKKPYNYHEKKKSLKESFNKKLVKKNFVQYKVTLYVITR